MFLKLVLNDKREKTYNTQNALLQWADVQEMAQFSVNAEDFDYKVCVCVCVSSQCCVHTVCVFEHVCVFWLHKLT